jgi:hypothetical protein
MASDLDASSSDALKKMFRKRQMREDRRELLRQIDALLPKNARRSNPVKTSGSRACGTGGRSLHNILFDVLQYIRQRGPGAQAHGPVHAGDGAFVTPEMEETKQAEGDGQIDVAASMRAGLLSSHTLFVAEICIQDWSVRALSPGALEFLSNSPWGDYWEAKQQPAVGSTSSRACNHTLGAIAHPDDHSKLLGLGKRAQAMRVNDILGGVQPETIRLARFVPDVRDYHEPPSSADSTTPSSDEQAELDHAGSLAETLVGRDAWRWFDRNPLDQEDPLLEFGEANTSTTYPPCPLPPQQPLSPPQPGGCHSTQPSSPSHRRGRYHASGSSHDRGLRENNGNSVQEGCLLAIGGAASVFEFVPIVFQTTALVPSTQTFMIFGPLAPGPTGRQDGGGCGREPNDELQTMEPRLKAGAAIARAVAAERFMLASRWSSAIKSSVMETCRHVSGIYKWDGSYPSPGNVRQLYCNSQQAPLQGLSGPDLSVLSILSGNISQAGRWSLRKLYDFAYGFLEFHILVSENSDCTRPETCSVHSRLKLPQVVGGFETKWRHMVTISQCCTLLMTAHNGMGQPLFACSLCLLSCSPGHCAFRWAPGCQQEYRDDGSGSAARG